MQGLRQPLGHVARFMNLAALDRSASAEGPTDDLAQRLGAIDDERAAGLGVQPALDQIIDQCPEQKVALNITLSKRRKIDLISV